MSRSNAPFMISAHSSGSSCSADAVESLTSQKSIVTIRRSPCIPVARPEAGLAWDPDDAGSLALSGFASATAGLS